MKPFARFARPLLLKKDDYLVDARDERFMITSFLVQDDKKEKIPAVVHVDGSGSASNGGQDH